MPQLSEHDLILLNSYLDGRLSEGERAEVEIRLSQDAALRAELESLRQTVALLSMAERVPVPRSFTLDPARYGKRSRPSLWSRLGLPEWAVATAAVVLVVICAGALLYSAGVFGGVGAPSSVAMQAAAPRSASPLAAGAATEAATEAAAEVASASLPTQATSRAAFAAPATQVSGPSVLAPAAPQNSGGVGGGQAGASSSQPSVQAGGPASAAGAQPAASALPTSAGALVPPRPAASASPSMSEAPGAIPSAEVAAADQTNLAASATPEGALALPGAAPSATPARIEGTEAQPFQGLTESGWILLGAGTVGFVVVVLVVTALMRRRPR